MQNTKLKILLKTIELFNEYGFRNVSLHQIAESLHVSPGNLTYHFKRKEDLMMAVYQYFRDDLLKVSPIRQVDIGLQDIIDQLGDFFTLQLNYRFFYLDLLEILRAYPNIKLGYHQQSSNQILRLRQILDRFEHKEILKPATSKDRNEILAKQIWMSAVFWLTNITVRGKNPHKAEMVSSIMHIIEPFLSSTGRPEFNDLRQNI